MIFFRPPAAGIGLQFFIHAKKISPAVILRILGRKNGRSDRIRIWLEVFGTFRKSSLNHIKHWGIFGFKNFGSRRLSPKKRNFTVRICQGSLDARHLSFQLVFLLASKRTSASVPGYRHPVFDREPPRTRIRSEEHTSE